MFMELSDSSKPKRRFIETLKAQSTLQTYNSSKGNSNITIPFILEKPRRHKSTAKRNSNAFLYNTAVPPPANSATKTIHTAPRSISRPRDSSKAPKISLKKTMAKAAIPQFLIFQDEVIKAYGTIDTNTKRSKSLMRNVISGGPV